MVKRILKITGIVLGVLLLLSTLTYFYLDESLPEGRATPQADSLATHMQQALNKAAWDTTHILQWTFRGNHHYLWDRQRDLVRVTWKHHQVLMYTPDRSQRVVYSNDKEVTGQAATDLVEKAWAYFCNDSYWLIAPFKVFDSGVERKIVEMEGDTDGLLVTFSSGGVTPGDSYLWLLDKSGRPEGFKMWVSILPIGGLKATWEGWQQLSSGVWLPTNHRIFFFDVPITNLAGGTSLKDLGIEDDPFAALE